MNNTVKKLDGTIREIKKIKVDKKAYLANIQSCLKKTELTWTVRSQVTTYARQLGDLKKRFNTQRTIIANSKAVIENFYSNLQTAEKGYLRVLRSTEEAVTSKIGSINKLVEKSSYAYTNRAGHSSSMDTQAALRFQEVHDEYQECYEFFEQHKKGFFSWLFSNDRLIVELETKRDALKKRLAAEDRLAEKERLEKEKQQQAASTALAQKAGATVLAGQKSDWLWSKFKIPLSSSGKEKIKSAEEGKKVSASAVPVVPTATKISAAASIKAPVAVPAEQEQPPSSSSQDSKPIAGNEYECNDID